MTGLYIHVPLCRKKCAYCDFFSVTSLDKKEYTAAVLRNIERYCEVTFDTIYFGGGTPSLMPELIQAVIKETPHTKNAEITAECNPETADGAVLKLLRESGVNRLSFGVQSLEDGELSALGRIHNAERAKEAIKEAHSIGFDNISADIMLAIPGQDLNSLERTIEGLSGLPLTHISAYLLKTEPNTPFGKCPPALPSEDETAELYLSAVRLLEQSGFYQYEISNFAKKGYECRHNLKYWRCEEYIGIGCAAHSYYGGKRFAVPKDITAFIGKETQPVYFTDECPDETEERVMLGLRLREGIPAELWEPFARALSLIPDKYYVIKNGRLSLTAEGFLLSNSIISTLLSGRDYD